MREFAITFGDFGNRGVQRNNDKLMEQGTGVVANDNDVINDVVNTQDEYEEDGTEEEETNLLRRSTRESERPGYLDDYILLAELDGERLLLTINDEPLSYSKASKLKVWNDACDDEIKSIIKNRT